MLSPAFQKVKTTKMFTVFKKFRHAVLMQMFIIIFTSCTLRCLVGVKSCGGFFIFCEHKLHFLRNFDYRRTHDFFMCVCKKQLGVLKKMLVKCWEAILHVEKFHGLTIHKSSQNKRIPLLILNQDTNLQSLSNSSQKKCKIVFTVYPKSHQKQARIMY